MNQPLVTDALLVVVEGPDVGKTFSVGNERVSIGRGREDTIFLRDASVTHHQVLIEWNSETRRHYLHRTGDSCTYVNNIAVSRFDINHELAHGDQIQVSGTLLRYSCPEDPNPR